MPKVVLDGSRIDGWNAFHDICRSAFGFPDFYGRNMDAWIDCMSGLRDDDGMTGIVLGTDEVLEIELTHAEALRDRLPAIVAALEECIEEVNTLCAEAGENPSLRLVLR